MTIPVLIGHASRHSANKRSRRLSGDRRRALCVNPRPDKPPDVLAYAKAPGICPFRKYRTIKAVGWRVNCSSGIDADFAG